MYIQVTTIANQIAIANLDSHGYQPLSRSVSQAMGTIGSCIVLFGNSGTPLK